MRAAVLVEPEGPAAETTPLPTPLIQTGRFPLEKAAEALDSDRIRGSVQGMVQVS